MTGWLRVILTLLALLPSALMAAQEMEVHGALAQGYVLSEGNNYFGDSTDGSRDFYEVAINGRSALTPTLLATGQLTARRAGAADDARLRVDFAQLDWRFFSSDATEAGLRAGKVKTSYGLYNDSRDVVFSRPGILMPNSIYYEGTGLRDLFFSVEGAQLYGYRGSGLDVGEYNIGWAREFEATDEFERSLTGGALQGTVEINDYAWASWQQDWLGGRVRSGLSFLTAEVDFRPDSPEAQFARLSLRSDNYVLSLQHLAASYNVTFEYRYSKNRTDTAQGNSQDSSDGAYLQYRCFVEGGLEWFLRYDVNYADRNDRNGRDAAADSDQPAHERFSRSHVLGGVWRLSPHWSLFGEYHYVDGTLDVPDIENRGREQERYWQMALLMLAYRF